jgi:AAA domain-containing protein
MKASVDQPLDTALRPDVQKFESFRTQHPFYNDAFNRTWALSTRGHSARVVIVCGPTGVGKSTLGGSLQTMANRAMESECEEDPSLVPSVLVKAIAPHGRGFSWKDFYIRTLEQLREPLIERKVFSPQQMTLLGNDNRRRS